MKLKILCLEPFYGGSHKNFIDGLVRNSRHNYTLFTLPSRFWKWRMRGAALHFYSEVPNPEDYDLLLTCGLMSLADLKALWGDRCPPTVVYLHETQLSYPLQEGEKMDYQFGFTDITTGLTADRLVFNSSSHLERFFSDLPSFIGKMPEFKPHWAADVIRKKSSIIYPGCSIPSEDDELYSLIQKPAEESRAPLIIWNHRWEYDKNPKVFFDSLYELDRRGLKFNLALLGENYQKVPKEFIKARKYFGERVLRYGWTDSREEYIGWLLKGDITVSTSIQENFGISVVEAVRYGCYPLLPRRLSYPELIPKKHHKTCIYENDKDLTEKLGKLIEKYNSGNQDDLIRTTGDLSSKFGRFSWKKMIVGYDDFFCEVFKNLDFH